MLSPENWRQFAQGTQELVVVCLAQLGLSHEQVSTCSWASYLTQTELDRMNILIHHLSQSSVDPEWLAWVLLASLENSIAAIEQGTCRSITSSSA